MGEIQSNSRIFITGKTGTGKTTFAKKVLWPQYTRRIFWDVKVENSDLLAVSSLCTTPLELVRALTRGKVSILYQPVSLEQEDFDQVCEIVFQVGNLALFVDEVAAVCSPSVIPPWYRQILVRGRSRGVGTVNISQRPRDCPNTIISETEHLFVFRLQLETDTAKLRQVIPREHLGNIYTMPYYCSLYVDMRENRLQYLKPVLGV